MTKHEHAEAYMLMEYASADGSEREVLWNSRDGLTPMFIPSATSDQQIGHINFHKDRYAPNHLPKVGDRIFVDMTEQRARYFATLQIEHMQADPEDRAELEAEYPDRETAVAEIAKGLLGQWSNERSGSPDILVVTAGYIEELELARAQVRDQASMTFAFGPPRRDGEVEVSSMRVFIDGQSLRYEPEDDAIGSRCYDRESKPISARRCADLMQDDSYRRVALTILDSGDPGNEVRTAAVYVSTIWLGMDHNHAGKGAPLIFETESNRRGRLCERRRYTTEAEARLGHEEVLAVLRTVVEAEAHANAAAKRKKD